MQQSHTKHYFDISLLQNTKQDTLSEKLITFEQNGLPAMPRLLTIGQKVYPEEVFKVESSWKDIVKDYSVSLIAICY